MKAIAPGLLSVALAAALPPGPAGEEFPAQVDRYLEPFLAGGNFSGAVLIAHRGKVLLSRGHGMANREFPAERAGQQAR